MQRIALILSTIIVVLILVQVVGVPLWTAAPDTVQVTVTHTAPNGHGPDSVTTTTTTIYDRTVHDAALAQRLQRDLAALPTLSPFDHVSCPGALNNTYDTYTLTWSRAGFFVERASAGTPWCTLWSDITLIYHESTHLPRSDTIFVDLHAALGTPLQPGV
ncbi:MAG: hypothetical protein ACRDHP_15900 [Ktedonobacterales bacterium]